MHEVIIYSKPTNALCVIKCILLHVASHQHVLLVLVTIIHHTYISILWDTLMMVVSTTKTCWWLAIC